MFGENPLPLFMFNIMLILLNTTRGALAENSRTRGREPFPPPPYLASLGFDILYPGIDEPGVGNCSRVPGNKGKVYEKR